MTLVSIKKKRKAVGKGILKIKKKNQGGYMEIKIRYFDWSTERNAYYREFINDHEHQLGFLSVSYFTHR